MEANPISCNARISACDKGVQLQEVMAFLSEVWEAKLDPSIISYCAGIGAHDWSAVAAGLVIVFPDLGDKVGA